MSYHLISLIPFTIKYNAKYYVHYEILSTSLPKKSIH